MTIGIIGAMEEEVTLLKESMNVVTTRNVIGCDFFVGSVEGSSHNIVLVRSGIGKVNAALCAQVLIDIFAVDSVINVGVAGAIDRTLKVGDIVKYKDGTQYIVIFIHQSYFEARKIVDGLPSIRYSPLKYTDFAKVGE